MTGELRTVAEGALAGAIATIPMSATMFAAKKVGLMGEYPPEIVTRKSLDAVGAPPPEDVNETVATVAHLAFGAVAGALFGIAHRRIRDRVPAAVQGIGYGLLVYVVSYNGWIPAARIMPEPEEDRPGRPQSMILAHVIYGMSLGGILAYRERERGRL